MYHDQHHRIADGESRCGPACRFFLMHCISIVLGCGVSRTYNAVLDSQKLRVPWETVSTGFYCRGWSPGRTFGETILLPGNTSARTLLPVCPVEIPILLIGGVRDGFQHSCSHHTFEGTLDNPSTLVTGTHPPMAFGNMQLMRNVLDYMPVTLHNSQNPHKVNRFLRTYILHITIHRDSKCMTEWCFSDECYFMLMQGRRKDRRYCLSRAVQ